MPSFVGRRQHFLLKHQGLVLLSKEKSSWCPGKKAWLSWVTTCSLAIAV